MTANIHDAMQSVPGFRKASDPEFVPVVEPAKALPAGNSEPAQQDARWANGVWPKWTPTPKTAPPAQTVPVSRAATPQAAPVPAPTPVAETVLVVASEAAPAAVSSAAASADSAVTSDVRVPNTKGARIAKLIEATNAAFLKGEISEKQYRFAVSAHAANLQASSVRRG